MSDFHKTYRQLVASEAERQLAQWGDDHDEGKEPLFILGIASQAFGDVAEAVVGNAAESIEENVDLALERLVRLGAVVESLHVLVAKIRARLVDDDE